MNKQAINVALDLNTKRLQFFPELDSLRALAVTMTLLAHYLPAAGFGEIPYCWYGVDIFFGISGFLITAILLNTKSKSEDKLHEIKNFFVRRVLRLFPAYYLLITVFWIARNLAHMYVWNNHFNLYFFTYTPNFFFYFNPGQGSSSFNHLWSLGVEEQFYLIWPWIILYMPQKLIKYFFLILILSAVTINYVYFDSHIVRNLPISNFHTLGIGAMLAYFHCCAPASRIFVLFKIHKHTVLFLSVILVLFFLFFSPFSVQHSTIPVNIFLCTAIASLIICAVDGFQGSLGIASRNKYIQRVGQLSYGIYLYHMPVPETIKAIAHFAGVTIDFNQHPVIWFLLFVMTVYALAWISYNYFESYFLKLKERF